MVSWTLPKIHNWELWETAHNPRCRACNIVTGFLFTNSRPSRTTWKCCPAYSKSHRSPQSLASTQASSPGCASGYNDCRKILLSIRQDCSICAGFLSSSLHCSHSTAPLPPGGTLKYLHLHCPHEGEARQMGQTLAKGNLGDGREVLYQQIICKFDMISK